MRVNRRQLWLVVPAAIVMIAVFVFPVGTIMLQSLTGEAGNWPSIDRFVTLLSDPFIQGVFLRTIMLGLICTAICLIIGLPLASAYVRATGFWKTAILFSVIAPLLINHVVRTYGWSVILAKSGVIDQILRAIGISEPPTLIYTDFAVVVGMVNVFTPFMVLTLAPALSRIDYRLYSAASSLGAGQLRQFRTLTLPLIRPGIVVGCVLVFSLSQGAFIAPLMLGGSGVQLTATLVYTDAMVLYNWPQATAVAVILLIVVLLVVSFQSTLARTKWSEK